VAVLLEASEADRSDDLFKISQIFSTLEEDDGLRIFQIEGKGTQQNLVELAFARGIDAGIIQSDTLASLKRAPLFPGMEAFLQYVAKLYDKEVHVLASSDIRSIEDLTGKRVNFGPLRSESFMTGTRLFKSLKVAVEPTELTHARALEKLRQGEIAAMVYVAPKPADLFQLVMREDNLHFLSIPANSGPAGYFPTRLGAEDYPQVIEQGKTVETLAVGAILMVYNWAPGTDRYRKVVRLVRTLLDRVDELKSQAYYPKWRKMDISVVLPGWTRFAPAEEWIKAHTADERNRSSGSSSADHPKSGSTAQQSRSPQVREALEDSRELHDLFVQFVNYVQLLEAGTPKTANRSLSTAADELDKRFAEFLDYQREYGEHARDIAVAERR
jgi:TRAP-type uncharacterized transport system substrate-binding protein